MSIQWRTILVLNLFVLGLAAVQGYIARNTAAQVVEERLAWQMSAGVSAFLQSKTYPLSDTMMTYLKDIFHTEWVVTGGDRAYVASSLSSSLTKEPARVRYVASLPSPTRKNPLPATARSVDEVV